MVRRHRITEDEILPVMRSVYKKLEHDEKFGLSEDSIHLFRVLWRFHNHRPGPPAYPDFNKENLTMLLDMLSQQLQET